MTHNPAWMAPLSRRQFARVGAGAAASAFGLAAWGCAVDSDTDEDTPKPRRGGILQLSMASGSAKDSLDPLLSDNSTENILAGSLYEPLVEVDPASGRIRPLLAESFESNGDATRWVFRVRTATFHDGRPVTSEDVRFSLHRHLDEDLGSPLFARLEPVLARASIAAVDERTVRLDLKAPDAFLPAALAQRWGGIVPAGTTDFETGVGTGPFRLKSFASGRSFELERNADYWNRRLPYLDGVRAVVLKELSSLVQSVVSGEASVSDEIELSAVPTVEGKSNVKLIRGGSSTLQNIVLDQTKEPFDDERVRRAIKLAVNRKLVLDRAFRGYGQVAQDLPVPVSDPAYPDDLGAQGADVEEAQRLLAEAGYPGGIDLTLHTAPAAPNMVDAAVVFAQAVKDAGIRVEIKQSAGETYWDQVWLVEPMYVSWYYRRQPFEAMSLFFRTGAEWNETKFSNRRFDSLLDQASATTDERKQRHLLGQAMEIAKSESGFVLPAFADSLYVAKRNVHGVRPALDTMDFRRTFIA